MTDTGDLIAGLLVSLGYGQTAFPGTNIFVGDEPGTPDNIISVREISGAIPLKAMGGPKPKVIRDRPDVQITVRKKAYADLLAAVMGIKKDLDGWGGLLSGKRFDIALAYEPTYLGQDENQRRRTTLVFHTHRERTP